MNLPPCDLESEAAVLSGILYSDGFDLVSDQTSPEHYFSDAYAKLLEASLEVARAGAKPDAITVGAWLRDRNLAELCTKLAELRGKCPDVGNIEGYARIVKEKCLLRRAISWGERTASEGHAPVTDVMAWLGDRERALFDLSHDIKRDTGADMATIVRDVFTELSAVERGEKSMRGVETGLTSFDAATTGLHGGELFVLAARPGMGKTALATQIADYVSAGDEAKGVILFSMEMPRDQLALRLISAEAQVDLRRLRCGQLTAEEWQRVTPAATRLQRPTLWIDDTSGITPIDMLSRTRRKAAEWSRRGYELGLVVVDYVQLMTSGSNRRGENRQEEVAYISRSLKSLARELSIPVIALAQLNRNVERKDDKRPHLSDLRESGAIEQDADCVLMLYRDEYYTKGKRADTAGKAELIISKQRNGPTGTVVLSFDKRCTYFGNLSREEQKAYLASVGSEKAAEE